MQQMQNGFDITKLYYSDDAFLYLSKWLELGSTAWNVELFKLSKKINRINPKLREYLQMEGLEKVWGKLQLNAPSDTLFSKQFHRWFDGLKTIRLLKRFTTN